MSVTIAAAPQQSSWWQRLTNSEPRTVVRETSTTTITSQPGGSFNLKDALRNGGIGAGVAGVLGGVSLLAKVSLPVIGKIGSVGGLVKLVGVGGALGAATAAIPLLAPMIRDNPTAKSAAIGAGIGAAAGFVLPLVPTWLGAAAGAGIGLAIHSMKNRPANPYPNYPGYQASPGWVPYGTSSGDTPPNGWVPVTPNFGGAYGMPVGASSFSPWGQYGAMNPYGAYGAPQASMLGAMTLPMTATTPGAVATMNGVGQPMVANVAPQVAPQTAAQALPQAMVPGAAAANPATFVPGSSGLGVVAPGTAAPISTPAAGAKTPKFPGAKTWIDNDGNIRQVGTGKVLKRAA